MRSRLSMALMLMVACGGGTAASTSAPTPAATASPLVTSTTGPMSDLAVVASRFALLGWWDGTAWVSSDTADTGLVVAGHVYQVVMLDKPIGTTVGSAIEICEPSATPIIHFDPALPGEFEDPGGIAIAAFWDLVPRPVNVGGFPDETHLDAVRAFLENRGILDEPLLYQHVRADLDGGGEDEVMIVAKRVPDDLFGRPGDYSLVILRKLIDAEWQTLVLEYSEAVADNPYMLSHSIAAVADLNGDGNMEIVIDAIYYEGAGTVAYEYVDSDLGTVAVLGGGCGA